MHSLIRIALVAVCMVSIVNGWGCQHHAASDSPTIDEYIRSLPFPPSPPLPPPTPVRVSSTFKKWDGAKRCETVTNNEGASITQLAAFAPNADVLWPGSLVQGDSINRGVLTPITVDRAPAVLTIGNIGNPDPNSKDECRKHPERLNCSLSLEVIRPSLRTIADASRQLVGRHIGAGTAARTSKTFEQYHSIGQAALKLSADARWLGGEVRATLSHSTSEEKSTWVVNFVQSYYDVSFNPPGRPKDFFYDGGLFGWRAVSVGDLSNAIGDTRVRPAYVSTVTFGRMLILSVSTKENKDVTEASLKAVVNAVGGGGSLDIGLMNSSFVKQSDFKLLVLGGNPETAGMALSGTGEAILPKLLEFYRADLQFTERTPGVPISYQLRWLGTPDPARITFTTDYTVDQCTAQKIVALGVRFVQQDDNKDKDHCVSMTISNRETPVWSRSSRDDCNNEWGGKDSAPQPDDARHGGRAGWFSGPPLVDNLLSDSCSNLRIHVSKTPGWGWKFKAEAAMWLEDGKEVREFKFLSLKNQPVPWKLGDGTNDLELSGYSCG